MRIEKYLDQAIERHGLKNDSKLAEMLGVVQSAVSHYRTGRRTADNEVCLRLAQLLEMENPLPIIMAADMDRAERAGQHSLWEVFRRGWQPVTRQPPSSWYWSRAQQILLRPLPPKPRR